MERLRLILFGIIALPIAFYTGLKHRFKKFKYKYIKCKHEFETFNEFEEETRSCVNCEHTEILIDGDWIDYNQHIKDRKNKNF